MAFWGRWRKAAALASRSALGAAMAAAVLLPQATCINPELVNTVSGGAVVPAAPGAEEFVVIQLINNSNFFLDALVSVDVPDPGSLIADIRSVFENIRPQGGDAAVVLRCPVDRVGLGSLSDPSSSGFRVGIAPQGKIGVAWGETPLVAGFNYDCGDTVLFVAINDATASGGVRIDAGVVSGAAQPVPAIDTFGTLEAVLTSNGF